MKIKKISQIVYYPIVANFLKIIWILFIVIHLQLRYFAKGGVAKFENKSD